jgi:hypothetical protein
MLYCGWLFDFQNDSASVPPSGSNALRTSSKTNIHNGNNGGSVGSVGNGVVSNNGTSSGESKSDLRVSCASGISANGNCSALTNGHMNGHSHSLTNGHSQQHSSSNGSITTTVVTSSGTLNGRHVLSNNGEGNNNGSALGLNSLSSQQQQPSSNNGTIRVQSHKLPLLHSTNGNLPPVDDKSLSIRSVAFPQGPRSSLHEIIPTTSPFSNVHRLCSAIFVLLGNLQQGRRSCMPKGLLQM